VLPLLATVALSTPEIGIRFAFKERRLYE
jgi:hypothetical protein